MIDCKQCSKTFETKKPGQVFCSPKCRASWNRDNAGVVPGRIQSASPAADGATVVVVRVPAHDRGRVSLWLPGKDVEILEVK